MDKEIKQYMQAGKKNLTVLYILYLCGVVAPLLPLIGAIFAYVNRDVADRYLATHYTFILRTFCIGLVGIVITFITTIIFIGPILYIALVIWFLLRIIIGFKYLLNDTAHPNCKTFWIK